MFWADRIAKDIIESGKYTPYWVDDMFTPSGFAHIGSLRGPLVHDMIFRALRDAGKKVTFTFVFNDFDPIDGLPSDLSDRFSQYMGFPLRTAPSPVSGFSSFAAYFAEDFKHVLDTLGVRAKYLSSWDMYRAGKFNAVIREALDAAEEIQEIYRTVSGSKKKEKGWLPFQVICKKCGKLGTTRVSDWDGTSVTYTCEPDMVSWAKGCGYTGKVSPFNGTGKLPWKVDWPAHWKVIGVTIEGAGKDHSSAGGSRDIARQLCKQVFQYPHPYNLPYEFFLIGGKKMSSSKGLGLKAHDLTGVLPAAVGRFLFTRTDYRQAIEFDPVGTMAIPDIFDEYDRSFMAYAGGTDENLARAFVLAQPGDIPKKEKMYLPRFRDVANYLQYPNIDVARKFAELKGSDLTDGEKKLLEERIRYAKVWLETYAPQDMSMKMSDLLPESIRNLSPKQREFLQKVIPAVEVAKDAEGLQKALYETAKTSGLATQDAFVAIYTAFLGKTHGPRAAWFLLQYPKDIVIERLREASAGSFTEEEKKTIVVNKKPELFEITKEVKEAFPSVSVGVAVIRNVRIGKTDPELEKEKQEVLAALSGLTTDNISKYPEITSYRRLYRETGIDWHSRRPSPEALLRRIALGKGLYSVNTCVDACNLVVIRNRVSIGAFDFDRIVFPTRLRFAGEGDEILLHGDTEPTRYSARELAYYDEKGGYNIDFNYRDSQRTLVTEETKNVWLNVEGVFDISAGQVAATLTESVRMITKYCGGTVEFSGLVA